MNRFHLSFVCLVASSACATSQPSPSTSTAKRATFAARPLPAVDVQPLKEETFRSIADVTRGRVTVIDLWATWCTACKEVSKHVELLAEAKKDTDLLIVGLDIGEDRGTVARFLEGKQLRYDIYLDPSIGFADALGQKELPAIIVVDREGVVRLIRRKLDDQVLKLVDELLKLPGTDVAGESATEKR